MGVIFSTQSAAKLEMRKPLTPCFSLGWMDVVAAVAVAGGGGEGGLEIILSAVFKCHFPLQLGGGAKFE